MKRGVITLLRPENPPLSYACFDCEVCRLLLFSDRSGVRRIIFVNSFNREEVERELRKLFMEKRIVKGGRSLVAATGELQSFFSGKLTHFTMKLNIVGTDFQKKVWNQLKKIPYGETAAYSDIALLIGRPDAARGVGQACNQNPLPVVIPCHRVIGKNGRMTGYAPGVDYKKKILQIEMKKG